MDIKIRNYKTSALLVVATPSGQRRFTAETFKQASRLASKGKDLYVLSREPSFSPPWRPVGRFVDGRPVPIASKPLVSATEFSAVPR